MAFRVVTISTPFALLWLATIQASRAKLMQNIDTRLSQLDARINTGNEECHEDIQAMRAQVAAFQREVASQYAPRAEIAHSFHEIREEFRQFRTELFRGRPL
jgi:hypothetical protein